ncbi:MAG: hypothetical protein ACPGZU_00100 [Ketobacter sp.]|nr:hypothetical protein [Ketobacter sp.]MEC8812875.1 hypothetical protein [Pseudomonadota bacterium]|tara:strand:+ start:838 stop:2208 length:1371 start_codon:yes stop_codon:yes gene_type:complete
MMNRSTPVLMSAILIALGACGAVLMPLWIEEVDSATRYSQLVPGTVVDTFYLATHIRDDQPLTFTRYDVEGTVQDTWILEGVTARVGLYQAGGGIVYAQDSQAEVTGLTRIDLNQQSVSPATTDALPPDLPEPTVNVISSKPDGVVISINGYDENQRYQKYLGRITATGELSYYRINESYYGIDTYVLRENSGYLMTGSVSDADDTGQQRGFMLFLDSELNPVADYRLPEKVKVRAVFNGFVAGYVSAPVTNREYEFFYADGSRQTGAELFERGTVFYGENEFYIARFQLNSNQSWEFCRYDYNIALQNCFNTTIPGGLDKVVVQEDGSLGLSAEDDLSGPIGIGLSIEEIEGSILANGSVAGSTLNRVTTRLYDRDGRILLDARPTPYRTFGQITLCTEPWDYFVATCYEPETYSAGTCFHHDTLFMGPRDAITLTLHCNAENDSKNELTRWQAP